LVGDRKLIPEFEDNVIGMKKGEEKEFEVTYPEEFEIKEVAGKTVKFKLKLKGILERILPELDDEFAKDLDHENLEGLRKKVKEDLEKKLEDESRSKLKEELVNALLERNPVDAPPSLVENEAMRLKREFMLNFQKRGLHAPPLNKEIEDKFRERAIRNVKTSIIIGAIAKKEEIKVDEKEVDNRLMEISRSFEVPFEKVREVYENNDMIKSLEASLLEDKVFNFLIEKSNIEEVPSEPQNQIDKEG
jgi:trigger factor